jgi:Dimerisation domain of Zinc Transporter
MWRRCAADGSGIAFDVNVVVAAELTVAEGHTIAKDVRHQILHHVPHAAGVTVHVDPATEPGEGHHGVGVGSESGARRVQDLKSLSNPVRPGERLVGMR